MTNALDSVRPRMNASGAISMMPCLQVALDLLRRQHVIERVVERPQIGIDLVAHVAGQKAEPLAGFDRRPRQYDAFDQPALETVGGLGDGDVGLAGAGGTDAEHQIELLERPHVGALRRRPRLDHAAAGRDLRLAIVG